MYIVALVIFCITVFFAVKTAKSSRVLRMSFWAYIAYSFLLLTHFFSGINYHFGNIYRILPYFIFCIALLLLGELIGRTVKLKSLTTVLKVNLNTLGILSIAGSVFFIFDILRLNQINFGTRIEDFNVSLLGVIGNAISSLGMLVWLTSLYHYRLNKIKIPAISYLCIISFVAGGVLSAGRQAIIMITLSSVVLLIWSTIKRKEIIKKVVVADIKKAPKPWGFYIIGVLFLCYFVFVSLVRSGISDIDNKIEVFEKGFNATTSPQTKDIIHNIGGLSDIYVEFCYYYSHELIRLDILYQNYDYHPLYGLSQMLYVERRVQWLFGKQADASWEQVVIALEDKGKFTSHTWSTFVADYMIDFGRIGAPIACALTGFIFGILYTKFTRNENSITVVRQCLICTGIIFSIEFSPLGELIYFIPLVLSSFIRIVPNIEKGTKLSFY